MISQKEARVFLDYLEETMQDISRNFWASETERLTIEQMREEWQGLPQKFPRPVAFRPGQKIKFPPPNDHITAYFEAIRYEDATPIVGFRNADQEYCEIRGYDLSDLTHV